MTTTPISLQDLRKRIYAQAKADKHHRFWGLYVHLCKEETLHVAYRLARQNNGAPGIDGVTFAMIERDGVDRARKIGSREVGAREVSTREVRIGQAGVLQVTAWTLLLRQERV